MPGYTRSFPEQGSTLGTKHETPGRNASAKFRHPRPPRLSNAQQRTRPGDAARILKHPDLLAVTAAVLLPNAVFLAGLLADLGMPPRSIAIALYLLPVLLLRVVGRAASLAMFLLVLALDLVWTLASFFGFSPMAMLDAFRFAAEVRLFASPLYVALMLLFMATSAATMLLIGLGSRRIREARLLPMVLTATMLTLADGYVLRAMAKGGSPSESDGTSVISATGVSGFAETVLSPGRPTALLVVVEALGQFIDPDLQGLVFAGLNREDIRASYDISSGAVPFRGSTTAAEIRELCASRLPYDALTAANAAHCLPRLLAAQGRDSVAIHGFSRAMFDRPRWYPLLGFTRSVFGEDLAPLSAQRCGSVFAGLCDVDIARALPLIADRAASGGLIYWLTLNTHVPFRPTDARPRFGCGIDGGRFAHQEICRMAELWAEVVDRIADVATQSRLARAEILIVGDHAPPLWSRRGRAMFAPGLVPWVRLTPRA